MKSTSTATVLLLACLAASALAAPMAKRASATVVGFAQGNVTINNANSFGFRGVQFAQLAGLGFAAFLTTAEQLTATTGSAQTDIVAGSFYGGGVPVTGWMAYFDAVAKWNSTHAGASNILQASLTASGAAAGIAFMQVDEVGPNNNIVKTQTFSGLTFTAGTVQRDSTGNIQYGQITATANGATAGATFTFTQATSAVYGKLTYGAVVTPKSTEVIVEIAKWTYANAANHLNLTTYMAVAVANMQAQGEVAGHDFRLGAGASQAFISNQQTVVVNGNTVNINNQMTTTGNVNPAELLQVAGLLHGTLHAVANSNLQVAKTVIAFPAGAADIIWDPSVGFEQPQTNAGSSAYKVLPAALIVLAATFSALFAL